MEENSSAIKRDIMARLCANEKIVELIGNTSSDIEYADDLIDVNIFPYLKVDYTVQDTGAYIGVAVSNPSINKNEIYKNTYITFLIISANSYMRFADAKRRGYCRTDLLAEEVLRTFNWNNCYGFKMKLVSDKEDALNTSYYFREIVFRLVSPNGTENGVKFNG